MLFENLFHEFPVEVKTLLDRSFSTQTCVDRSLSLYICAGIDYADSSLQKERGSIAPKVLAETTLSY
jgi:hypothetical protein